MSPVGHIASIRHSDFEIPVDKKKTDDLSEKEPDIKEDYSEPEFEVIKTDKNGKQTKLDI